MTEPEENAVELLLSDPEIVAWLDLGNRRDDREAADGAADDESPRAA
jgi:hypothetical protein